MAVRRIRTVIYRRKREQKTDYLKRLKILASGKPRLLVRFTNQKIIAQVIVFVPKGDKVIVNVDSSSLRKYGWNYSFKNFPSAYLTGLLMGKKALKNGLGEAILDTGFKVSLKKSKIYAFLKGAVDAGMKVPHGESIFPGEEQINGQHISKYAQQLKSKSEAAYQQRFAKYLKENANPERIGEVFKKVKQQILAEG